MYGKTFPTAQHQSLKFAYLRGILVVQFPEIPCITGTDLNVWYPELRVPFLFGVLGRVWNPIVSVPDHHLLICFYLVGGTVAIQYFASHSQVYTTGTSHGYWAMPGACKYCMYIGFFLLIHIRLKRDTLSQLMRLWHFSSSVNSFFKRAWTAILWG